MRSKKFSGDLKSVFKTSLYRRGKMRHPGLLFLAISLFFLFNPVPISSTLGSSIPGGSFTTVLAQPAALYNEPGNQFFEPLAELPARTNLRLIGIFGDFVQADLVLNGRHLAGFLHKDFIRDLPQGLPVLDQSQVPWQEMFLPTCAPGQYDPATNTLVLSTLPGEDFLSYESDAWTLDKPVQIKFDSYSIQGEHASSIKILGSPEGGVDPSAWWKGVTAMGIEIQRGSVYLTIMDGISENSKSFFDLKLDPSQPMQIVFDDSQGKSFSVLDKDGRQVNHIELTNMAGAKLPNGLFPDKKFYFGFVLAGPSSMSLKGLSIATQPDGRWKSPADSGPGLYQLAKNRGLLIGNMFDIYRMIDRRYCEIMDRNFNLINVTDFSTIGVPFWSGPDQYNFFYLDRILDFAASRGWKVSGAIAAGDPLSIHQWLRDSHYSRVEYINLLKNNIQTVVGRYKGRVQYWNIANEYVVRKFWQKEGRNASTLNDFWYNKIGPDYLEMAFRWVHEADPAAKLFLNDDGNMPPFNKDDLVVNAMMLALVKEFKARNVPMDAIGTQIHTVGPQSNVENYKIPTTAEYIQTMQDYAKLGVRIYITEMDVDLGNVAGSQAERYDIQAVIYRTVMDACLESKVCDVFNVWGISDGLSNIVSPFYGKEPNGDPLLFDRNYNPKPAFFTLQDALAGIVPAPTPTGSLVPTQAHQSAAIPPAPAPGSSAVAGMIDDFEDPAKDGSFDKTKWILTGTSTKKQAIQQAGLIRLVNPSDEGDVTLTSRKFSSVKLDEPFFMEAALLLPEVTAAGQLGFSLTGSSSAIGTWWGGCAIERYSSQYLAYCSDFVFPTKEGHSYETSRQSIQPGSWHVFRFELNPSSMTLRYLMDGVEIGNHVPVDADTLRKMKFRIILNTWKTKYEGSLIGYAAYIANGKLN
jgi:endo-1,4-beta-xylanase